MKPWSWKLGVLSGTLVVLGGAEVASQAGDPTEAAFAKLAALVEPGPLHRRLAPLVGDWKLTLRWRAAPEQEWRESAGRAARAWILGGRYLEERVSSEWMGQPFEGRGLLGYDALREEYTSVWMDDRSTWPRIGSGPAGADPRVLTTSGTVGDPVSGDRAAWFRSVLRITSDDEHVHELWSKDASGTEFKALEMLYVRG